jgi:ribosomal protein S8
LINYLKDANFNFGRNFFNKNLPQSDILNSQLQQRQLDSMKVQKYISDFQNAIQKVRSEVDKDYYQNDNNDDAAIQPAKRQRYLDNNRQIARVIITNTYLHSPAQKTTHYDFFNK